MDNDFSNEALDYHKSKPSGKIKIASSKPLDTQKDLSLAYTPGVGAVSSQIAKDKEKVWDYTNRGNSIAVVSDGTAILGLGDIGPEAGLPVMEGKAVLFKKFADIDAYPLCMKIRRENRESQEQGQKAGEIPGENSRPNPRILDPSENYIENFIQNVASLEPNFAGINLEDVRAPICFDLQKKLDEKMEIPVFHDDQDGTAVILVAGLINSLEIVNKKIENVRILINGAGSAGIACARLLLEFGVSREQLFLCDSKGLITTGRENLTPEKQEFAQQDSSKPLDQAIKNADVFIGVSIADILTQEMVRSMADNPIVFAVANPVPEIMPNLAYEAGAKVVATGRSDFPNQINNVLGFPGIFRGAIDARASTVNKEMKIAAAKALAELTHEQPEGFVKEILDKAYPDEPGQDRIIPKPFDLRVVPRVAKEVARAAIETNVAKNQIPDLDAYEKQVFERIKINWS